MLRVTMAKRLMKRLRRADHSFLSLARAHLSEDNYRGSAPRSVKVDSGVSLSFASLQDGASRRPRNLG